MRFTNEILAEWRAWNEANDKARDYYAAHGDGRRFAGGCLCPSCVQKRTYWRDYRRRIAAQRRAA